MLLFEHYQYLFTCWLRWFHSLSFVFLRTFFYTAAIIFDSWAGLAYWQYNPSLPPDADT
jgi:hypothetical protein